MPGYSVQAVANMAWVKTPRDSTIRVWPEHVASEMGASEMDATGVGTRVARGALFATKIGSAPSVQTADGK